MLGSAARSRLLPIASLATSRPPLQGSNRLFIFQPDHLGDILLSEPAVRYLRARSPNTEIFAVVGPWSAEICRMAWPVDEVIEIEFPGFERSSDQRGKTAPYRLLKHQIQQLRGLRVDDAVVLRDDAWWAAWLAYGSVGGRVITSDDPRLAPFGSERAATSRHIHRTDIVLELVRSYLGERVDDALPLDWDMSPRLRAAFIDKESSTYSPANEHRIIFHPGSGAAVKAWPLQNWRAVAKRLDSWEIILTGTSSERELCEAIAEDLPHVSTVAGDTTLSELAGLLQISSLATGTDNGPMHLAGAVKTPTVRIFGPSNPRRYGPYPGSPGQVALTAGWSCERCEDLSATRPPGCGCMIAITPGQVVQQIQQVLDERP